MLSEGVIRTWFDNFATDALSFLLCVILALVLFFVGIRIIGLIRKGVKKALEHREVEIGVRQFTDGVLKVVLYVVLGVVILNLFGIHTSSVAAAIASLGLTAGLALQGALSNFAGGVLILVLHPFVVGDYIIEDTHRNEGTVTEISIFYTKLRTVDQRTVVIPNGVLANSSLTNVSGAGERQMDLRVGIGYDDNIRLAKDILMRLAKDTGQRIEGKDKDIKVFVSELAGSSIQLGVRFWVKQDDYWQVKWSFNERIIEAFKEAGIEIAYDQLDIHIREKETVKNS